MCFNNSSLNYFNKNYNKKKDILKLLISTLPTIALNYFRLCKTKKTLMKEILS